MPGARVLRAGGDGVDAHHAAGVGHRAAAALPVRGGVNPCYGRRGLRATARGVSTGGRDAAPVTARGVGHRG
jgi:hypothetical protein